MNRRRFLFSATGVLAVNQPLLASLHTTAIDPATLAGPELLSFLGDREYITALGQSYLKKLPHEACIATLVDCINLRTHTDTYERLPQQIAHEFATGDIVLLNGWMLSKTEARQTALFSLLYS